MCSTFYGQYQNKWVTYHTVDDDERSMTINYYSACIGINCKFSELVDEMANQWFHSNQMGFYTAA